MGPSGDLTWNDPSFFQVYQKYMIRVNLRNFHIFGNVFSMSMRFLEELYEKKCLPEKNMLIMVLTDFKLTWFCYGRYRYC